MFLGYQENDGIEFIASVADTREELENNIFVKYTRIEKTQEDYQLVAGEYLIASDAQEKEKEIKRAERDTVLQSTDIYMLPDYPISEEEREFYKQYRQYLRDLPASQNFPDVEILSFDKWKE